MPQYPRKKNKERTSLTWSDIRSKCKKKELRDSKEELEKLADDMI
jgi:hypothetical protein